MSILRSGVARTTLAAAAVTILTATLLTAGSPGTAAAARIECDDVPSNEPPFYDGRSASDTYDDTFTDSWRVPNLGTHIPQGTATWSNWQGEDDLILVAGYDKPNKTDSRISAIDAKTGDDVGYAEIDYSHVGGIAIFESKGWAYISGPEDEAEPGRHTIRKYSLAKLKNAIKASETSKEKKIQPEGAEEIVYGSSFLTSHGPSSTLWAGRFHPRFRDKMYSYTVADNGDLDQRQGSWEVPTKTQGLVVTEDMFIYSTSHDRDNRGNIYVVRRGEGSSDLDTALLTCFRAPSMSEGLTVYGSNVYLAYESGASYYRFDEHVPRNVITNLHKAPMAKLKDLLPRW